MFILELYTPRYAQTEKKEEGIFFLKEDGTLTRDQSKAIVFSDGKVCFDRGQDILRSSAEYTTDTGESHIVVGFALTGPESELEDVGNNSSSNAK